jgi:hypothetical protein
MFDILDNVADAMWGTGRDVLPGDPKNLSKIANVLDEDLEVSRICGDIVTRRTVEGIYYASGRFWWT